ncbi:MAG: hypothetical protein KGH81_08050, partial [Thaumarchaeota archaeon]|nr:hypothetical protein [Nitrososphaerota archaeon]
MVQDFLGDLGKAVITLLVVIDPIASIPIIMGLTGKMEKKQRTSILNVTIITVTILLFVFAFIGSSILSTFGISIF